MLSDKQRAALKKHGPKKRGPKPREDRSTVRDEYTLRVRLTLSEKRRATVEAAKLGLSVSEFVRMKAMAEVVELRKLTPAQFGEEWALNLSKHAAEYFECELDDDRVKEVLWAARVTLEATTEDRDGSL